MNYHNPPTAEFDRHRQKIYGSLKSAEKMRPATIRGHNLAIKIIRPLPDFFQALEFDTVKYGTKVRV